MARLRYLTAGESHGPALVGILEGLPAGLPLRAEDLDAQLARRQGGHGRSRRQAIESDAVRILGGVRHGRTLGSPLALVIENRDHANWAREMAVAPGEAVRPVTIPRPGHADLAGAMKYGCWKDLRDVLERASARETAMRVALGAAARRLLADAGVAIASWVVRIGEVVAPAHDPPGGAAEVEALGRRADRSPVRCLDGGASRAMVEAIDAARDDRDSLGGVVEVVAAGVPEGLGSHVHADRKLDGRLAGALASLPAVKGVEIGGGFALAAARGSAAHDAIGHDGTSFVRPQVRAGGLEGGMTNGQPLCIRLAKKPIATLMRPLPSVDLSTLQPADAHVERADTCAVPALGVIAEAVVALVLADALLEALGGDTMEELVEAVARRRRRAAGPGGDAGPPVT